MIRKPRPGEFQGRQDPPINDPGWRDTSPNIYAMLTETQYDDKQPRTTSTLLIFCDGNVLRVCLNDRDNNRSAFFTGTTLVECLDAMENALAGGTVDWRMKGRNGGDAFKTPF